MPRKWKPDEYEYQQEYIKRNIRFVSVPFNLKNTEDVELYNYLDSISEKKAAYIKRLIKKDMGGYKTMTANEIIENGLYDAAVALMDQEIREAVHADIAPCTELEFLTEYMKRHEAKYGTPFVI